MAAAAGTYHHATLVDNWFEERLRPAGSLAATGGMLARTPRAYESDIAYIGERFDVLARISRSTPRETYAVPDDGFRVMDPTTRSDMCHPRSRLEFVAQPPDRPALITKESVPEVSYEQRRPVAGPRRGFGAALSKHEDNHDQRHWNTTVGDVYGEGGSRLARERVQCHPEMPPCGMSTESEAFRAQSQGVKVGRLCGENLNESTDPAVNTRTQRAWLYAPDASLAHADLGGTRPALTTEDNALSLSLGEGAMAKVRADMKERKGRLYRVATNITKGLGQRGGVNVFQDG
eukprot:TRINITY_DN184_c0_g1_i1.p1 TRINITY_DN184_c0_g1~~TRINITY_DN184_c0_g1_i1.p1  ORF type:complete len:290 (+),score=51.34 TRINITY_DN184_c0_g1_i1:105-974(+)